MSLLEAVQSARGETTSQTTPTSQGGTSLLNAVQSARGEAEPTPITQPKKKLTIKPIFEAGKKLISQLTGYVKATKQKPFEAAAGAGTKVIQFFGGDLAGSIQQGVASVVGVDIPDRWNLKKQAKAFEELNRMNLGAEDKQSISAQAFETGKFIGAFVPYYFAGAVAGASVGTKILAPIASKFIPKAVKLVPVISNAIGFTGVGQIEFDEATDGTRVNRLKTDLVMLALFEVGGALAKGIAKGTAKVISKAINGVSNKLKGGDKISIAEIEKVIAETKQVITKDTGKPAEVVLANNITNASEKEIQALTLKAKVPKAKVSQAGLSVPKGVSKGLQPLAQEARKYKSAEEFGVALQFGKIEKNPTLLWDEQRIKDFYNLAKQAGVKPQITGKEKVQIGKYGEVSPLKMPKGYTFDSVNGYVKGNTYFNNSGVPIKIGEQIEMHFAGVPVNMPRPWTLIKAENYFSSVGYDNQVKLTVRASNGKVMSFNTASVYSPSPVTQVTKRVGEVKPQITAPSPPPSPIKKVSPPQTQKVVSPTEKFQSRVFERLKADHPQLEGELTYDPIKLKEQAKKAVNLIAKDKQKAFDIAMGKEPSKEVTSTAVNIAMSEKALDEGNHELYAKLIKTRSLEQTRRGQELVSEKGSLDDNSTSRYIKELIGTRLDNVGKKYLSGLKEGMISNKEHAIKVVGRKAEELERKIVNKKLDVRTALTLLDELACI